MTKIKALMGGWAWYLMPVIPDTWEVKIRGSQFKASLGKKFS
jgi:hypothetical protein